MTHSNGPARLRRTLGRMVLAGTVLAALWSARDAAFARNRAEHPLRVPTVAGGDGA